MITTKTKLYAVLGWPVSHSLSPFIHNFWFNQREIDALYIALPVKPESIATMIPLLKEAGFSGFNVTLPHKEAVFDLCDELSPVAQKIGAVNTVKIENGKIYGTNTDKDGFFDTLQTFKGLKKICLLGAGGAARAILLALSELNMNEIIISNRTAEKAEKLIKQLCLESRVRQINWDELDLITGDMDMIVNATTIGLDNGENVAFPALPLNRKTVCYDIIYKPLRTAFLKKAEEKGLKVINGLDMLIGQAARSFSFWTEEKRPEIKEMSQILQTQFEKEA